MYFPYLRGKQFELLALRELAEELHDEGYYFNPIIEPVKATLTGLKTAVTSMLEHNLRFALVLNPNEGDFKYDIDIDILGQINVLTERKGDWYPAFIYHDTQVEHIKQVINENDFEDVMIVCPESIDIKNPSFSDLINTDAVKYVVVAEGDSRTLMRQLFKLYRNKNFIRLDDKFNEVSRNADYSQNKDESFTEEHLYYIDDGFYGFGDYTALSKHFVEGGMLPYAIAIHLIYQREDEVINIHHFVSDTNDDRSNIQGKFFEAATKVRDFYKNRNDKTPAVEEIIQMITDERYPGLGYLKKLSIKNSIQLMNRILKNLAL